MNSDGKMEFPRDMMVQDCLQNSVEPLYGFVTNVTLLTDQPCIQGVECFENGTTIDTGDEKFPNDEDILSVVGEDEIINTINNPESELEKIDTTIYPDWDPFDMDTLNEYEIQLPKPIETKSEGNATQRRSLKSQFRSSNFSKKEIVQNHIWGVINNKGLYQRNARSAFSIVDRSRDIAYIFGNEYLITYSKKGRYETKSTIPRFTWDQTDRQSTRKRSLEQNDGN